MINQVVLVGKIKDIGGESKNKRELLLEVERPFREVEGKISDIFTCKLWSGIFNKILSLCAMGDLIAIKGRVIYDKEQFIQKNCFT